MGLDRAPIEFQTFYFSHLWLVPPRESYMKKSIFLFVEVKNIDGHLVEDPGQTPTQASMLPPGHWSCLKIRNFN